MDPHLESLPTRTVVLADDLRIQLEGRWPCRLPPESEKVLNDLPWTIEGYRMPSMTSEESGAAQRPRCSIVIVTCNGRLFVKLCLISLVLNTGSIYELLLVDNGSSDGTDELVGRFALGHDRVRLILNSANRGFSCAVNQALEIASGEVLVLLNSDTVVPPGWLTALLAHLEEPGVGLVGPVTNRSGNEAEVPCSYTTYGELKAFAAARRSHHTGQSFEPDMLSMFCLAFKYVDFRRIGRLDEQFGIGLFEDDDYSWRFRRAGLRLRCAKDCFVHHFGQVSFGELGDASRYGGLLGSNRKRYEAKWQHPWRPPFRRIPDEYARLRVAVRETALAHIPSGAHVAVVSRGDNQLLDLPGVVAFHFPANADGCYAGYHPRDSQECIALLERAVERGTEFLLFPKTSFWWLEFYEAFRDYLESRSRGIVMVPGVARFYGLSAKGRR